MSFLGKPLRKNWRNSHAKGRRTGIARSNSSERRALEAQSPAPEGSKAKSREYLAANCVVLAAAIFAEPWAKAWANEMLPMARQLDGRGHGQA
jgi:hypothetical protein